MAYYYPEGAFGPICDLPLTDEQIARESRPAIPTDDGLIEQYGIPPGLYDEFLDFWGEFNFPVFIRRKCKERVLDDGTIEKFDCVDEYSTPLPESQESFVRATDDIGLRDIFFEPKLTPESCSPYQADINIRPLKFFGPNGTLIKRTPVEGSTPVTFPVTSENQAIPNNATITATFSEDRQNLVIGGTGEGIVQLRFTWDDKPSISGQSVGTLTVAGASFSQGNNEKGSENESTSIVTAGQSYPITLSGNSGTSGSRLQGNYQIEFDDDFSSAITPGTYPITVAAQGTNGRGTNAAVKSVSSNRIQWTDSSFQNDTDAELTIKSTSSGVTANFTGSDEPNLALVITGTGTVTLEFEWDDNPNVNGQAVGQLSINGQTYNQSGDEGDETITLGGGGSFDVNATLSITEVLPTTTTTNIAGYWSDEGNKYGVWVNPAICTLPQQPQLVSYKITIDEADTYGFTFGCDDNATLTINDENSAFLTAVGGIFAGGSYNTPYTGTRALTAGTLILTVNCTNSDAGFQDANGDPTGLAYDWQRNPGGWYIKMCKGGLCSSGTNITWIPVGPHPAWSDFMDEYAVFPSNIDPLLDQAQQATWNINIPTTGNYTFECSADNTATFTLDGTQIATSSSFTTTTSVSLTNISEGPHTLVVSVTNVTNSNGANEWTTNPGGVAWRIQYGGGSIDANFQSNGRLLVTGAGAARLDFDFEWDDNPSTYDTALGTVAYPQLGVSFTQNTGSSSGSDSDSVNNVTAGDYGVTILNNSGGFTVENSGKRLCFKDLDGNDCNAQLDLSIVQGDATIASSLDLNTPGDGNLFWHTRLATGYTFLEDN